MGHQLSHTQVENKVVERRFLRFVGDGLHRLEASELLVLERRFINFLHFLDSHKGDIISPRCGMRQVEKSIENKTSSI